MQHCLCTGMQTICALCGRVGALSRACVLQVLSCSPLQPHACLSALSPRSGVQALLLRSERERHERAAVFSQRDMAAMQQALDGAQQRILGLEVAARRSAAHQQRRLLAAEEAVAAQVAAAMAAAAQAAHAAEERISSLEADLASAHEALAAVEGAAAERAAAVAASEAALMSLHDQVCGSLGLN